MARLREGFFSQAARPRIRGLAGTHAAAVCALALLSRAPLSGSQLSLSPRLGTVEAALGAHAHRLPSKRHVALPPI
jgi:hypothetical protein